jgi:hypothetical protein
MEIKKGEELNLSQPNWAASAALFIRMVDLHLDKMASIRLA